MKIIKHLIITISFFLLEITIAFCQPGPPGGGGPGDPPCWPPSTCETPINNELIFLLVAGLGLGIYFVKKRNIVIN
jgi:hypothetical protein